MAIKEESIEKLISTRNELRHILGLMDTIIDIEEGRIPDEDGILKIKIMLELLNCMHTDKGEKLF